MGSHYIPVNSLKLDGVSIQPEVYCPANGFPDPADPNFPETLQNYPEALGQACIIGGYIPDPEIYIPPTIISEMPVPGDGEIFLLCADKHEPRLYFRCATNSGQYTVKVFGTDDVTPVYSANINSNSYFSYDLPVGNGKTTGLGFTTFLIVISATVAPNYLTSFIISTPSLGSSFCNPIISAKFKTSGITTLGDAFKNNFHIQSIELIGNMDALTSLSGVAQGAVLLENFVVADSMNALITLINAFNGCISLKSLSLLNSLPELLSMESMLANDCGVLNFTMPSSLPKLTTVKNICYANKFIISFSFTASLPELLNMESAFYNSYVVNILLPTNCPKVTTLRNFAANAIKLEGEFVFPEMNQCTTLNYTFASARLIEKLHFTGGMPNCTNISGLITQCKKITELKLPTSIGKLTSSTATAYAFDACDSLKKIIMPDSMEYVVGNPQETAFLSSFSNCYLLEEMTKMTTWPNRSVAFQMGYSRNLVRFDQPDANIRNLAFGVYCAGFALQLNYFDIAWSKLFNDNNYKAILLTFESAGSVAFPISEIERITNALLRVPAENGFTAQFICNANTPNISVADRSLITFLAPSAGSVILQRQSGQLTTSWVVGDRLALNLMQAKEAARTATISGDTITKTAHTIPNGTEISFASLTGITGVLLNTVYYVVEAATDVFKVSDSPGGSAIAMSGTGSCTFRAFPKVVAVGAGTVTIDFCYDVVAGSWNITTGKYAEAMIKARHKGWNCS